MLYATVRQRKIHVKNPTTVIQNGIGVDKLMLSMDEEWLDMDSIVCVFTTKYLAEEEKKEEETEGEQTGETEGEEPDKEPTMIMVEKEIANAMSLTFGEPVLVPWENLTETGTLSVSCTGYVGGEKVMTTMLPDSFWTVVQNGPMTGKETVEPTPSLYDQIIVASGNAQTAAKLANDVAVELRTAKENGEFDGADGVTPSINVGNVLTGAPGSEAQVTRKGTETEAIFDFVIPRGAQGIQGVPGAPGAPGKNGTNGRDGKDGTDGLPGRDGKDGKDAEVTVESITNALGYVPLSGFYFTERKEFENAFNVKSEDIYSLFSSIATETNDLTDKDDSFVMKEFVFKTDGYNDYNPKDFEPNLRGELDVNIKKPVFLVMAAIHGYERAGVLSLYRFFKDMADGKNIPEDLREGAIFKVVPVANPFGFDNAKRVNKNGVDLNRNFDYKWKKENAGTIYYSGDSKCSEPETQAITKWLDENGDAAVLLDIHNSSHPKEVAALIGLKTVSRAKRVALQGLDRVIPYWRNVIGYAEDSIFSYSSFVDANGGCVYYATDTLGIPGIAAEFSSMQNGSNETLSDETIAAGAEAIGNMLIEFFRETRTDQLKDLTNVAEVGA